MEEQIIDDYIEENIEPVEFEGAKQDMDSKEQLEKWLALIVCLIYSFYCWWPNVSFDGALVHHI